MIPIAAPTFYDAFPAWFSTIFHSGISSAAVMAILMNILFNHIKTGNPKDPSVMAEATRVIRIENPAELQDGDHVQDGRLIDADGKEVRLAATESDDH